MKIMAKSNLLAAGMILVMTGAVLAAGMVIIDDILYRFQERVLRLELAHAGQVILQKLNRSGLRAAARSAGELQARLRDQEGWASARFYIVDATGRRVVFHPEMAEGATADADSIGEMFSRKEGRLEYQQDGVRQFAVFTTVEPLGWLMGISLARDEMLAKKDAYLRAIGAITFVLLCFNALVINLFGQHLARRLRGVLDCVGRIERGDLSARIAAAPARDEIGRLQEGINAMSARIEQRTREREEAEAQLREREARIRRLVESNIIGIFFWDMAGAVTEANDAFLNLVGYTRGDLEGGRLRWDALTPPEFRPRDEEAVAEVRATGSCSPYEKDYIHRDGRRIPVLVGGTLLEGSGERGVAFVLDLSERKQAEADRQARLAAEAASRAKSTFLATMSHELRTPLNAILGYAQLLQGEPGLSERQTGGLATIRESGQQLLTLINDLLDLAKIEAGRLELQPAPMNLSGCLSVVGRIIRVRVQEKSLRFVHETPPDLPPALLADERALRQVLLNLLSNAVRFTDRGLVVLRVQVLERQAEALRLHFEVADSGVGMTGEQMDGLFQPFRQVGDAERRLGGTGLGLAISRQLVRLMGGEIEVDSSPGAGSRFWFDLSLPIADAPAAVPAPLATTGYRGPRRRILIADDVVANRAYLCDLLESLGFDTAQAGDGDEAVSLAQADPHDLVLMDLVMPRRDGFAAIRAIRAVPGLESLPIVAVSASANQADQGEALAAGANAFLPKPIDQGRLLQVLGECLALDWIHSDLATPVPEEEHPAPIVAPGHDDMAALHRLALTGNMRAIREAAAGLAKRDGAWQPFAATLDHLAQGYQSKAIVALIEAYLHKEHAS